MISSIYPLWIVLFFFLISVAFSYYILKRTAPLDNKSLFYYLFGNRIIIFFLLIIYLAGIVLSINQNKFEEVSNYIFIDNSLSISAKDSSSVQTINNTLNKLRQKLSGKNFYFSFDSVIKEIYSNNLQFKADGTDFGNIFEYLNEKKIPENSNILIISDGIINSGENPLNKTEFSAPVFSLMTGDTSSVADISISYLSFPTGMKAGEEYSLKYFINSSSKISDVKKISLYVNNKIYSTKNVSFRGSDTASVIFSFKPAESGFTTLSASVEPLTGELNLSDNSVLKSAYIKPASIKVLLVSDSPSPDFSFIKNCLEEDNNYEVTQSVLLKKSDTEHSVSLIDKADVIVFVNFPVSVSEPNLKKITTLIESKNKPFLFICSDLINYNQLLNSSLDEFRTGFNNLKFESKEINFINLSPLQSGGNEFEISDWNKLPPVHYCTIKTSSFFDIEMSINYQEKELPFILSSNQDHKKSLIFLFNNFWKWRLLNKKLYDSFIKNTIGFLSSKNENPVNIVPSKTKYLLGEKIIFEGEIFDQSMNYVNNETMKIEISNSSYHKVFFFENQNNIYSSEIPFLKAGKYIYEISNEQKTLGRKGEFEVGDKSIELENLTSNPSLLRKLAENSDGKFYTISKTDDFINYINAINKNKTLETKKINEYSLPYNHYIMLLIIALFSIEWFIRKRKGML